MPCNKLYDVKDEKMSELCPLIKFFSANAFICVRRKHNSTEFCFLKQLKAEIPYG